MIFQHAWAVLTEGMRQGAFPGAVAIVANDEEVIARWHGGYAAEEPRPVPMQPNMIFDVASLTKVVATLPAVLHLVETGRLSLDERIATYIDSWRGPLKEKVTVRQLLTHTGGLAAWYPTYAAQDEDETTSALDTIVRLGLAYEPGTKVEYSCLGYIILGHIVQAITDQPLDRFVGETVFHPLKMKDTAYRPLAGQPDARDKHAPIRNGDERIVPTERDNVHEKRSVAALGLTFTGWRDGLAHGEVHDGNARYGLKGVSGNAGLFTTADDLVLYGQAWLKALQGKTDWLSPALARLATTNHTTGLDTSRGLGWMLFSADGPWQAAGPAPIGPRSWGELLSPGSFGHNGFTGTSLWIDPAHRLLFVLLTNRVHPYTRTGLDIVRPRFHNAALTAALRHQTTGSDKGR